MARPPGKFEFDLLQFIASRDGITVREIHEQFGQSRGYIRGTIVKSMDRLHKKGLVKRDKTEGSYIYRATAGGEEMDRQLVESFIKDRLGGRLKALASFFAEDESLPVDELKKLVDSLKSRLK